jgi:ABC-type lipoprotein release transport system permease subunit
MTPKQRNIVMMGVFVLLVVGAVLALFRDSLFSGSTEAVSPEVQQAMEDAAKNAQPPPAEPLKSNFRKGARAVGSP